MCFIWAYIFIIMKNHAIVTYILRAASNMRNTVELSGVGGERTYKSVIIYSIQFFFTKNVK